jgi:1-acyl-sn-glycerol-3-phosphate acyltransferase
VPSGHPRSPRTRPLRARTSRAGESGARPDLVATAGDALTRLERTQITAVRKTFDPGAVDTAVRWLQRNLGATWINFVTKNLKNVHGIDRLPPLDASQSFLCVSNHRSFFDLYVVTATLVARGMPHRIVFPVRANFFYTNPLGLFVNGAMSFFAMYPPLFRERERAALNLSSLDEVVWLLKKGGTFCGLHPEGTRKKDDDPYTFLPAQSGVGRIIHHARVPVLPVFVNGLGNDFAKQVEGGVRKNGTPIVVVFGKPIDFGAMLDAPPSPRIYRRISERTLEVIGQLGEEERAIRSAMPAR